MLALLLSMIGSTADQVFAVSPQPNLAEAVMTDMVWLKKSQTLATTDRDDRLHIWNLQDRTIRSTFDWKRDDYLRDLIVSPDEQLGMVLTFSRSGQPDKPETVVFEWPDGDIKWTKEGYRNFSFSPDGNFLLTVSEFSFPVIGEEGNPAGNVEVFNADTGELTSLIPAFYGSAAQACWSPNGDLIATIQHPFYSADSKAPNVKLFTWPGMKVAGEFLVPLKEGYEDPVIGFNKTGDSIYVYTGGSSESVEVVENNLKTKKSRTINIFTDDTVSEVNEIRFEEEFIVVGIESESDELDDSSERLYSVKSGKAELVYEHAQVLVTPGNVPLFAASPGHFNPALMSVDKTSLVATQLSGQTARPLFPTNIQPESSIQAILDPGNKYLPFDWEINPQGTHLVAVFDRYFNIYDMRSRHLVKRVFTGVAAGKLQMTETGHFWLIGVESSSKFSSDSGLLVADAPDISGYAVEVSRNSNLVLAVKADSAVVWDMATLQAVSSRKLHYDGSKDGTPVKYAISMDGKHFAVAYTKSVMKPGEFPKAIEGWVEIYRSSDGQFVRRYKQELLNCYSMVFASDNKSILITEDAFIGENRQENCFAKLLAGIVDKDDFDVVRLPLITEHVGFSYNRPDFGVTRAGEVIATLSDKILWYWPSGLRGEPEQMPYSRIDAISVSNRRSPFHSTFVNPPILIDLVKAGEISSETMLWQSEGLATVVRPWRMENIDLRNFALSNSGVYSSGTAGFSALRKTFASVAYSPHKLTLYDAASISVIDQWDIPEIRVDDSVGYWQAYPSDDGDRCLLRLTGAHDESTSGQNTIFLLFERGNKAPVWERKVSKESRLCLLGRGSAVFFQNGEIGWFGGHNPHSYTQPSGTPSFVISPAGKELDSAKFAVKTAQAMQRFERIFRDGDIFDPPLTSIKEPNKSQELVALRGFRYVSSHSLSNRYYIELGQDDELRGQQHAVLTGYNLERRLEEQFDAAKPDWEVRLDVDAHELSRFAAGTVKPPAIAQDDNARRIFLSGDAGVTYVLNQDTGELIATIAYTSRTGWVIFAPDGMYATLGGSLDNLSLRLNSRALSFENFDQQLNRPDVILARLGYADPLVIEKYAAARLARLSKAGIEDKPVDWASLPTLLVQNKAEELADVGDNITLSVEVDAGSVVKGWCDGSPLWGGAGVALTDGKLPTVKLRSGKNVIELMPVSSTGQSGITQIVTAFSSAPSDRKTYVVSIGVSKYKNPDDNLDSADKDARDFLSALDSNYAKNRQSVVPILITNEHATREQILESLQTLLAADVDDRVICFFAGHGWSNAAGDYRFGTHDFDFDDPSSTGISWSEIDQILKSCEAREKLLFLDTCQSGSIDPRALPAKDPEIPTKARSRTNQTLVPTDAFGLMQATFADISRSSGTIVIAAATGEGFALETSKNGYFTRAILEALNAPQELTGSSALPVSGLRDYVFRRVKELTKGRQQAVSRESNLRGDFNLIPK